MNTVEPRPLELGAIRLRWLNGGAFRMDGAAVFGQLPRPVWSTLLAPDDYNRVGLVARVLLVETAEELGLTDAGLPHTLTARQGAFLAVDRAGSEYSWRHTLDTHDLEVLLDAGLVEQVESEATVAPGVRVVRTGGHTPGHQAVILEGQHETAICLGDLLPTRHHLDPVCVPSVDDFPLGAIAIKRAELGRARQIGAWLTVAHDPEILALRCGLNGRIADEHR